MVRVCCTMTIVVMDGGYIGGCRHDTFGGVDRSILGVYWIHRRRRHHREEASYWVWTIVVVRWWDAMMMMMMMIHITMKDVSLTVT